MKQHLPIFKSILELASPGLASGSAFDRVPDWDVIAIYGDPVCRWKHVIAVHEFRIEFAIPEEVAGAAQDNYFLKSNQLPGEEIQKYKDRINKALIELKDRQPSSMQPLPRC